MSRVPPENQPISQPMSMFAALDDKLVEMGMSIDLIVCGGIVIQRVYLSLRDTHDVDSLTLLDDFVKDAVAEVGQEFLGAEAGNTETWINDDAVQFFSFDEILPENWQDRAREQEAIYAGEGLRIYPLARRDLILTKLFGFFTRFRADKDKDIKDLKLLGWSSEEVREAADDLFAMLSGTSFRRTKAEVKDILGEVWG